MTSAWENIYLTLSDDIETCLLDTLLYKMLSSKKIKFFFEKLRYKNNVKVRPVKVCSNIPADTVSERDV